MTVFELARLKDISEYDVFVKSYCSWNGIFEINDYNVESDYMKFCYTNEMPFYVRHYLKQTHVLEA